MFCRVRRKHVCYLDHAFCNLSEKFLVCSNKKYTFPLGAGLILCHSSFLFSRWPTASKCSLEDHHCCKLNPFDELKEMHHSDQNLVANMKGIW